MNINTVWTNTIDSISSVKDKVIDKYNSVNVSSNMVSFNYMWICSRRCIFLQALEIHNK